MQDVTLQCGKVINRYATCFFLVAVVATYCKIRPAAAVEFNFKLRGEQGSFSSPNFPNNYPRNTTVFWKIEIPSGRKLMLSFIKFDLEKSKRCHYDYVMIRFDPVITWKQLAKYCNGVPSSLESSGPNAEVKFVSDPHGNEFSGFSVEWSTVSPLSSSLSFVTSALPTREFPATSTQPSISTANVRCKSDSNLETLKSTCSGTTVTETHYYVKRETILSTITQCQNESITSKSLQKLNTVNSRIEIKSLKSNINTRSMVHCLPCPQTQAPTYLTTFSSSPISSSSDVFLSSSIPLALSSYPSSSILTAVTSSVTFSSYHMAAISLRPSYLQASHLSSLPPIEVFPSSISKSLGPIESFVSPIKPGSTNSKESRGGNCSMTIKYITLEKGNQLAPPMIFLFFILSFGCACSLGFVLSSLIRKRRRISKSRPATSSSDPTPSFGISQPDTFASPDEYSIVEEIVYGTNTLQSEDTISRYHNHNDGFSANCRECNIDSQDENETGFQHEAFKVLEQPQSDEKTSSELAIFDKKAKKKNEKRKNRITSSNSVDPTKEEMSHSPENHGKLPNHNNKTMKNLKQDGESITDDKGTRQAQKANLADTSLQEKTSNGKLFSLSPRKPPSENVKIRVFHNEMTLDDY